MHTNLTTVIGAVSPTIRYDLPEGVSMDQVFRVMFYVLVYKDRDYKVKWVNSVRCNEFYKDALASG